jgi:hypothetical protein
MSPVWGGGGCCNYYSPYNQCKLNRDSDETLADGDIVKYNAKKIADCAYKCLHVMSTKIFKDRSANLSLQEIVKLVQYLADNLDDLHDLNKIGSKYELGGDERNYVYACYLVWNSIAHTNNRYFNGTLVSAKRKVCNRLFTIGLLTNCPACEYDKKRDLTHSCAYCPLGGLWDTNQYACLKRGPYANIRDAYRNKDFVTVRKEAKKIADYCTELLYKLNGA